MNCNRTRAGFTLLELSIVIVIIALVTGMGLISAQSVLQSTRRAATENKLDVIERALMEFRARNNRLPCPADVTIPIGNAHYGAEPTNLGNCRGGTPQASYIATSGAANGLVVEGAVPVKALGLADQYLVDGWGQQFAYAVATSTTVANSFKDMSLSNPSFQAITVSDASGANRSSAAVYALVSYGPDGHGGYNSGGARTNATAGGISVANDELTDCHCTSAAANDTYSATYVQKEATEANAGTFDDVVRYKERWQLQTPDDGYMIPAPDVYIADTNNHRIRKVTGSTGIITTVAGNGTACAVTTNPCGDGGAATSANLNYPYDVVVDSAGNIYIADYGDNRIRKVAVSTGVITTIAGTGTAGSGGDNGLATGATFTAPIGLAVDSSGNVYIADWAAYRVRKVTASTGIITTVAGNGTACAVSTNPCGDTGAAISAQLNQPYRVAVDRTGNIYITDHIDQRIRKVAAGTGIITTVAGTGTQSYTGDGGPATSATFYLPIGLAIDNSGNLYIADTFNLCIRKVDVTGNITTFATSPSGLNPIGITLDSAGNVYVASFSGGYGVSKVSAFSGTISTLAGHPSAGGYGGDGGAATSATLNLPSGVAVH